MKRNNKAFTLIELLAVIAIISIIAAIATPNVITLINNSNKDQIYSDAKLAISKAKYKYRKDSTTEVQEHTYTIEELIDTEGKNYEGCVKASTTGYSIYIKNTKYHIGNACEEGQTAQETEVLKGKAVVQKY